MWYIYMYTYVHTLVPIMHPDGADHIFREENQVEDKAVASLAARGMGGAMGDSPLKSVEGSVIISAAIEM